MAWLRDEVWFDTDVLWFREQPRKPFVPLALESAFATHALDPSLVDPGLERPRGVAATPSCRQVGPQAPPRDAHRARDGTRPRLGHDAPDRCLPAVERGAGRCRAAGGSSQPDVPARPGPARATRAAVPPAGRPGAVGRRQRGSRRRPWLPGSTGIAPRPSASRTQAISSAARSSRSRGRTGSPGTRSRTASRTSATGSTATSTRFARSSRSSPRIARPIREPRAGRRRHQLPQRRHDGRARLASERPRRRHLLPAPRPAPERADRDEPDRPSSSRRISSTASSPRERR